LICARRSRQGRRIGRCHRESAGKRDNRRWIVKRESFSPRKLRKLKTEGVRGNLHLGGFSGNVLLFQLAISIKIYGKVRERGDNQA